MTVKPSALEKEIVEVSKQEAPSRGESRQDYLGRVARVLARIDEEDWNAMSKEAKDWSNEASEQIGRQDAITDPTPGMADAPVDETPKRRGKSEAPPPAVEEQQKETEQELTGGVEATGDRPPPRRSKAAPKAAAPKKEAAVKKAAPKRAPKKEAEPKVEAAGEAAPPPRRKAPAPAAEPAAPKASPKAAPKRAVPKAAAKKAAPKAAAPKRKPAAEAAPPAPAPAPKRAAPKAAAKRAAKANGAADEPAITTLAKEHRLKKEEMPLNGIKRLLCRDPALSAVALEKILQLNGIDPPRFISIRTSRAAFLHSIEIMRQEGMLTS